MDWNEFEKDLMRRLEESHRVGLLPGRDAIALIEHKNAEIERLKNLIDKITFVNHKTNTEAIEEFWDKLKRAADFISGGDYGFSFEIREDVAEDIIKELTEESK